MVEDVDDGLDERDLQLSRNLCAWKDWFPQINSTSDKLGDIKKSLESHFKSISRVIKFINDLCSHLGPSPALMHLPAARYIFVLTQLVIIFNYWLLKVMVSPVSISIARVIFSRSTVSSQDWSTCIQLADHKLALIGAFGLFPVSSVLNLSLWVDFTSLFENNSSFPVQGTNLTPRDFRGSVK